MKAVLFDGSILARSILPTGWSPAETGERGYLITGEEVYLESYEGALADRSSRIASLEELAREIPEFLMLVPELKTLIASRDRELETAIALRRAGNFDETVEAVRAGLRKNLSEQIRGVLQQMETIVTERLRLTQTDYRHRIKQVTWIMTASAYLSLALGVLGLAFLTGHLRDQIRTMRLERDREEAVRWIGSAESRTHPSTKEHNIPS